MAMSGHTSDEIKAIVATATAIAPLDVRRMFGTTCLFNADVMVAIVHSSGLYLKVDDTTRGSYDATDQPVFAPKPGTGYRSFRLVPADATRSEDALRPWLTDAIGAAGRLARR